MSTCSSRGFFAPLNAKKIPLVERREGEEFVSTPYFTLREGRFLGLRISGDGHRRQISSQHLRKPDAGEGAPQEGGGRAKGQVEWSRTAGKGQRSKYRRERCNNVPGAVDPARTVIDGDARGAVDAA